jgi:hypothetical protein
MSKERALAVSRSRFMDRIRSDVPAWGRVMGVLPGLMSAVVLAAQGRVRGQCRTEMDKLNMHAGLARQWT